MSTRQDVFPRPSCFLLLFGFNTLPNNALRPATTGIIPAAIHPFLPILPLSFPRGARVFVLALRQDRGGQSVKPSLSRLAAAEEGLKSRLGGKRRHAPTGGAMIFSFLTRLLLLL